MNEPGLQETVTTLRRIATTGAVAAAVLLAGAAIVLAASLLFSVARFSPYGLWSVVGVLALAALAAGVVWLRGPGALRPLPGRKRGRVLPSDGLLRAPPPAPIRRLSEDVGVRDSGRLGAQATVNRLIEAQRFSDALLRLDELERADPRQATFCQAKRHAIARRAARARA